MMLTPCGFACRVQFVKGNPNITERDWLTGGWAGGEVALKKEYLAAESLVRNICSKSHASFCSADLQSRMHMQAHCQSQCRRTATCNAGC
jgi:hypothetical protein